MRLALVTAFVFIVLPATTKGQSTRLDVSSLQAGAHTSVQPSLVTKSLAWRQTGKMDPSTGGHRHTGRGLVVGLVAGAIYGVVDGRLTNPGEMGRGYNEAVGAVGFGAVGAVCGAIVGYAWRSEK
jgi:hypothetical protein